MDCRPFVLRLISSSAPLRCVPDTRTYIVKLKSGVNPETHLSKSGFASYHNRLFRGRVLNGYAVELTETAISLVKAGYRQEIEYVEEDQAVYLASEAVQTDAAWGI
jgi:hypothetical protein